MPRHVMREDGRDQQVPESVDLVHFRVWVDGLVQQHDRISAETSRVISRRERSRQRRRLDDVRNAYGGRPGGSAKDSLRNLIASGMVKYRFTADPRTTHQRPAQQLVLDIAVFALWPVVIMPKLSDGWYEALLELSSPHLARLVAHARLSATTG